MRSFAVLLGVVALAAAVQAAPVRNTYHFQFAKEGGSENAFYWDRNKCARDTTTSVWDYDRVTASVYPSGGEWRPVPHPEAFVQCMQAKGYQRDPGGRFKTAI